MMRSVHSFWLIIGILFFFSCRQATTVVPVIEDTAQHLPPDERFGELFEAVQMARVFPDGKTFVDCTPTKSTAEILNNYEKESKQSDFDLVQFVNDHFDPPTKYASGFTADTSRSVVDHINVLWPILTRTPDDSGSGSLIPLPYPYIVPGGRFGEIYYWDSYFTMLGLQAAGNEDMLENMIKNFAHIIDEVGFIPNGNRTYFLTRSQPPFFAKMVTLLAEEKGKGVYKTYLPQLEKEYEFWTEGYDLVDKAQPTQKKVVFLEEGIVLNRYWDQGDYPRAESYKEDIETIEESKREASEVYRDLRSACESGWDFSSRWFEDVQDLGSIHTTDIIPMDLNSLMYHLEWVLSDTYAESGDVVKSDMYTVRASARKAGIQKYCWSEEDAFFMDYDFVKGDHTEVLSAAGTWPLEEGIATEDQARKSANTLEAQLLKSGGVVSTLINNGQQWDYPNGWAPQQWMAIAGLRKYGHDDLAQKIKDRWVALNTKVYKNTGKLVEKYNVVDLTLEAGGGEYPVQDGFGWTNGVLLKLLLEE
ncbi:MAG: alpha,alpha-trehalase TreF [Bacteroidia bacterium]|nr:alpha,alpha-trehalase TreF [Bacteroidia bacterium]